MKVLCIHGPGDIRLTEMPPPRAGSRDVVLQVGVVGICGSDLGYRAIGGTLGPTDRPMPLGHELCGTVVEVGAEVRDYTAGDRVIINPMFNAIGNGGPEGGFGQQLLVRDIVSRPGSLLRMPETLGMETGALAEPLAVALHAVNRSEVKSGDKIAIFGAGTIGLAILAALKHRGLDDIVVFELSALRADRAVILGARAAFDPRQQPPAAVLAELHGESLLFRRTVVGTRVFFDAAGAPGLTEEIIRIAPASAMLIMLAVPKVLPPLPLGTVLHKELTIRGSLAYPTEFPEAVRMLANGFDVSRFVTHRFSGAEVIDAFATAAEAEKAIKVLVRYGPLLQGPV